MFYPTFVQMKKMLVHLNTWLELASRHAKEHGFDPNVLAGMRLAPDQFPLTRQVQSACDTPKLAVARISGKPAPSFPDTEQTLDELRARIDATIAFLDGIGAEVFEGWTGRTVTQPRWEGKVMDASDYWVEHVIPNFYFHVTHAYAILRHNGVKLGKLDYLGKLSLRSP